MERLSSKYKSISFLGDFNIGLPWIDWSQDLPVPRSCLEDSWLETCEFCNVKQIVNCLTRYDNFLDLVLTSRPDLMSFYKCIAPISSSDHAGMLYEITMEMEVRKCRVLNRNFKMADFKSMANVLLSTEWGLFFFYWMY